MCQCLMCLCMCEDLGIWEIRGSFGLDWVEVAEMICGLPLLYGVPAHVKKKKKSTLIECYLYLTDLQNKIN